MDTTAKQGVHRPGAIILALASALLLALTLAGPAAASTHRGFTVKVKTGTLTLTFNAQTMALISGGTPEAGAVTTAIAPATAAGAVFSFPIEHGTLNSATGHGTVAALGGITLESHLDISGLFESSSSVSADDPAASLGSSSLLKMTSSNFTPPVVALFTLKTAHARVSGTRHAVTIRSIPAALTATGVQLFGHALKVGQQIATVTIAAKD